MRKKIIIIAAILVVIIGALVLLFYIENLETDEAVESTWTPRDVIYILGESSEDTPYALTVDVYNEQGSFTIINIGQDDRSRYLFTVKGLEDFDLQNDRINSISNTARVMVALDIVIEGETELSDFGLADPAATIDVQYMDGTSATVLIGNRVPGGGTYAKRDGVPIIYRVTDSMANNFLLREMDFVDTIITEFIDNEFGMILDVKKAVLGGSIRPDPIVIEAVPPRGENDPLNLTMHLIVSPINGRLSHTFGFEKIATAYGLIANRVEAKFETIEELRQWGLDEPYSTLEIVSIENDSFTLLASAPNEEGLSYIVRENRPFVYSIDSSFLPWLELTYFDIMDKLLIMPSISSVSVLEVHLPDRSIFITIEGDGNDLEVFVDGIPYEANAGVDSIGNFRNLYRDFLSTGIHSIPDEPMPNNAPVLVQFVYNYRHDRPPDTVTIYGGAARRVFIQLNDETPMLGLSSFVDHLLNSIDTFLLGEQVITYIR